MNAAQFCAHGGGREWGAYLSMDLKRSDESTRTSNCPRSWAPFLQTDPVGYEDDLNLYMYVSNDPLNLVDPTGRQEQERERYPVGWLSDPLAPTVRLVNQIANAIGDAINAPRQETQSQAATQATTQSRTDERVPVFRVVDPVELAHVAATGNYGSNPSQSGKYFAMTESGAQNFAAQPMNEGSTITSTTLPQSVLDEGFGMIDPGGAGPSVFFAQPQLPTVYENMTPPVIVPRREELENR